LPKLTAELLLIHAILFPISDNCFYYFYYQTKLSSDFFLWIFIGKIFCLLCIRSNYFREKCLLIPAVFYSLKASHIYPRIVRSPCCVLDIFCCCCLSLCCRVSPRLALSLSKYIIRRHLKW
jgi:hypothetical protein